MFKVCYRNFKVWSRYFGSSFATYIGEPVLYLLAMGYGVGNFVQQVNGMSYAQFIAPALVVVTIMNAATFETTFSSYTRLAVQKTFDAMLFTPLSLKDVLGGEILWAAFKGLFSALVILGVLLAFGLIKTPWVLLILPLGFIEGIVFASCGLLMSVYAKGYEVFNYYFSLFVTPMFLFSGTFFPLENLPHWIQKLAWIFPLTHASLGAREVFLGAPGKIYCFSLLWLICITFPLIYFTYRKMKLRVLE